MEVWTYAGDTVAIDVTVTDNGVAADLSEATGELIVEGQNVICTIVENVVTAEFVAPEAGSYDWQMQVTSDAFTRTIAEGVLRVKPSLFTEATT